MKTSIDNLQCCPEPTEVITVQTVADLKKFSNSFVYVQSINTSFFVDCKHRITWVSSGVVEKENYDLQENPLNLRNQFLYDPSTKEVHYFSNKGYDATFSSTVKVEDLEALEQKIQANTNAISVNSAGITHLNTEVALTNEALAETNTNLANETAAREQAITEVTTQIAELNSSLGETNNAISEETSARQEADNNLQEQITSNLEGINGVKENLNQEVEQSTEFTSDVSTVTVNHTKVNLSENTTNLVSEALPVASTTEAGVMNASTFEAVQNNAENVDAILNGAVALNGLAADVTQEGLTQAWEDATGKATLVNRASIYDIDNNKVWYYYGNINEWKPLKATSESEVNISTFTNETAGIIQGSTQPGQLFAEPNGTGSVNGWDKTQEDIANLNDTVSNLNMPKLYEEYGQNTDGALTQKFVSRKLNVGNVKIGLDSKSHDYGIAIGAGSDAGSSNGLAIGRTAKVAAIAINSIVIGESSKANGGNSTILGIESQGDRNNIVIGNNSTASLDGNMAIGHSVSSSGLDVVSIGNNVKVLADRAVAIGENVDLLGESAIGIGSHATTKARYSVALGARSTTSRNNEVSVGNPSNTDVPTRFLANVTAGELDTDAVNLKQLNDAVAALQAQINELKGTTPETAGDAAV